MTRFHTFSFAAIAAGCACIALVACGGNDDDDAQPVIVSVVGPNVVSQWSEIASATISLPPAAAGTAEEQRPNYAVDLATVHVAMYDAVIAIAGTHRPYAITPTTVPAGASQEAAAASAAYRVLLGLFPARSASYQAAYDSGIAALPAGNGRDQGVAVGAEVAAGILALRANDGRSVVLAPYVPGTTPGAFRGTNPVGRPNPFIKPFAVTSNQQFRAPGPPLLTSVSYAADVNETMALGSAASPTRTAAQTETARFHTEPPPFFWGRNLRTFMMTSRSVAEHARLAALLWVVHADTQNTCFESKYHFQLWRPTSAITLADTDGNAATAPDAAWAPVVPTPNHPEYPAAHSCVSSAMARALRGYYGTSEVTFAFDSTVTASTHNFASTSAMVEEFSIARIAGGMHFRTATVDGAALGSNVAEWVLERHFRRR